MKLYCLLFLAATSLLRGQPGFAGDAEVGWKIEEFTLTPVKLGVRSLTASIIRLSDSQPVELSDQVALEKIDNTFIWNDRLVLLGDAEKASVVEIFDLMTKKKVDWFVCYQPRRISDNWIAYAEFYFGEAQGRRVPTEVLLVYDLAKTPAENRLTSTAGMTFPLPVDTTSWMGVEVGLPVFPRVNARERSYRVVFETERAGRIIGTGTITLLSSGKLVFGCSEQMPGMGFIGSRQYLAVVDLSRGLENAPSQLVPLPTLGEHATKIEIIEDAGPGAVRLVFPAGEYAVNDMVVQLPDF